MNNYPKRLKTAIRLLVPILISISIIFIIIGFVFLFRRHDWINKQQAITWIIVPMICTIIWACIPIAMDNSLSNERLKISLNRLEILMEKLLNESGDSTENGENAETENAGPDSFIQAVNTMFGEISKEGVMEILGAVGKNSVNMEPSRRGKKKLNNQE